MTCLLCAFWTNWLWGKRWQNPKSVQRSTNSKTKLGAGYKKKGFVICLVILEHYKKLIFESLILHGGPTKCSIVWLIWFWIVQIRCAQRCMDGIRFFFWHLKSFHRIWVGSSSSDLKEVSKVLQNSTDLQENDISCYF